MRGEGTRALACFDQPRRAIAVGGPEAAALPAGARIVNAPVEALRIEPQRIRHPQDDHLSVLECDQAVVEIAGRHRHVVAQAERVVLIDPRVVARLGAVVANAREAWAGILVEAPAFGAVIARRLRPAERPLAFPAI